MTRPDAEALCEAVNRPSMRFVPVKTAEQQAALMLVGLRERLIRNWTSSPTVSMATRPSSGSLPQEVHAESGPA
jgi:transposase